MRRFGNTEGISRIDIDNIGVLMLGLLFKTVAEKFLYLVFKLKDVCLGEFLEVGCPAPAAIGVVIKLAHIIRSGTPSREQPLHALSVQPGGRVAGSSSWTRGECLIVQKCQHTLL